MRALLSFLGLFVLFWYLTGSLWGPVAILAVGLVVFVAFVVASLHRAPAPDPQRAQPKFQAPEPLDDTIRITATVRIRALPSEDDDAPPDRSQPRR
jgi:uncharacterized protein (DUF58 family)